MAFPSPAVNGQTYVSGNYTYVYNATLKLWSKQSTTGVSTGNSTVNTAVTANGVATGNSTTNTAVSANGVNTGNATVNTAVTANGVATGNSTSNTALTANGVNTGNSISNTALSANGITTGNATHNTAVSANGVTTGNATHNTAITANGVATGNGTSNTSITGNSVATSNTTTNTVIKPGQITLGTATINSTSYSGTANNTVYVGDVTAINVVSNAQLQANLAHFTNTSSLYLDTLVDVNAAGPSQGQVLTWNSTTNLWTPQVVPTVVAGVIPGYYGSFYDGNANQTIVSISSEYNVRIANTEAQNGVTVVNNTDITIAYSGTYTIAYSIQLVNPSNGQEDVDIWLEKNGTNIEESASRFTVNGKSGSTPGKLVAVTPFLFNCNAGDVFRIKWSASSTQVYIASFAETTSPFLQPKTPGVIVAVQGVSNIISAPPGTNSQIVFNDSGISNATAGFTFNKTTNNITIGNSLFVTSSVNASSLSVDSQFTANSTFVYANNGIRLTPKAGSTTVTTEGSLFYDSLNHALNVYTDGATPHELGQQTFVRVYNSSGSTITKGTAVYINGASYNRPIINKAIADGTMGSAKVIGVVFDDIPATSEGFVLTGGLLQDIDTSSFTVGQQIYISPSSAGTLTAVQPSYPNRSIVIGHALNSAVSGQIYITPEAASGLVTLSSNLVINQGIDIIDSTGSRGTSGQVLTSNGSGNVYWSTVTGGGGGGSGSLTQVNTGNGLTGGPITTTGTISVVANAGIIANSTGVFVNAAYINTISANSASYLGGYSASDLTTYTTDKAANAYANAIAYSGNAALAYANAIAYSGNAALAYSNAIAYSGNAALAYANAIAYSGNSDLAYANAIAYSGNAALAYANAIAYSGNAAQAYANAIAYSGNAAQAYANAISKISDLTANDANHLGGVLAASYQLNSTLNANIASYLPTYTGIINTSSIYVGGVNTLNAYGIYTTNVYTNNIFVTSDSITNATANNVAINHNSVHIGNSTVNTWIIPGEVQLNGSTIRLGNDSVNTAVSGNSIATTWGLNANDSQLTYGSILVTNNYVSLAANSSIDFDVTTYKPTFQKGRMYWDNEEQTVILYGDGSSFEQSMGQREWVRCKNTTLSTITKGSPVYINGVDTSGDPVHGHHPTIALGDASNYDKSQIIGLAGEDITAGSHGYVVVRGYIEGLNTSALTSGQRAHLGFQTPGTIVQSAPEYPNFPTDLGFCLTADATVGTFYVDLAMHTAERFRTTQDMYVGGDLTVSGNLSVTGNVFTTNATNLSVSDNMIYIGAGDNISPGATTFTGSGLNDMLFRGVFEGTSSIHYYVKIDSVGTTDTFAWSKDNFVTTVASGVAITGGYQALDNGIKVQFNATTGHTLNNKWDGTAAPINVDLGWVGNYNDGTYHHTGLFRDHTDGVYKFFQGYTPEPDAAVNIDTSHSSFKFASVQANVITANLVGTANNANNLNGQPPSYYTNASNMNAGTLPNERLSSAVVNTSANFSINGVHTHFANLIVNTNPGGASLIVNAPIIANGSAASGLQYLASTSGGNVYWASVAAGTSNIVRQKYTANGTSNTFTVAGGYTANNLDVYMNGIKLQTNIEANVQSGTTFTILGDTPPNNAVIEVVGLTGTPIVDYTKYVKTFNITGNFSAPVVGVARYVPLTDTTITTIRMTNGSNIVGADLIAQVYKNGVLDSTYTLTAGNYTRIYTTAAITLTTSDYLTVNISQGVGNNFSFTISN
jgi:hypothetical protein